MQQVRADLGESGHAAQAHRAFELVSEDGERTHRARLTRAGNAASACRTRVEEMRSPEASGCSGMLLVTTSSSSTDEEMFATAGPDNTA